MNNQGNCAVITGGGSGIGEAVCHHLASKSVVVVVLDIDLKSATAVAKSINANGGQAYAFELDVTKGAALNELASKISAQVAPVKYLCHSAAIQHFGRLEDFKDADVLRLIEVNLFGTYLVNKAFLPMLVKTEGSLVNIASLAGQAGLPYDSAYAASKGGVIAFTKSIAKEYADRPVRINAVAPGAVDTPMYRMAIPENLNSDILSVIPRSAKGAADAEQLASLITYLLLESPNNMTGSIVALDGATS